MELLSWILHLDEHLAEVIGWMGTWFYALVFGIVFCETGLVITPFLPGDSLLFAVGALAASESSTIQIWLMLPLLIVAAVLGDAVNYAIGKWMGPQIFRKDTGWLLNKSHLLRAQHFYEKHGGKAIILARFLRSFEPLHPSWPASAVCSIGDFGCTTSSVAFYGSAYSDRRLPIRQCTNRQKELPHRHRSHHLLVRVADCL